MIPFKKLPFPKEKVWISSDFHAFHKNIAKGTTNWDRGYRDFPDEITMTQEIIKNINEYVKVDDCLIHGGDWSFQGAQNIWNFRKQINCKNIYHILGNHDAHIYGNSRINISDYDTEITEELNITLQFDSVKFEHYIYAQDCFTEVKDLAYYQIEKQPIVFSHYPFLAWYHCTKGVWNLSGHEHGDMDEKYYFNSSMDVGIDVAFKLYGIYRPFNFLEIKEIIKNKSVNHLTHH